MALILVLGLKRRSSRQFLNFHLEIEMWGKDDLMLRWSGDGFFSISQQRGENLKITLMTYILSLEEH